MKIWADPELPPPAGWIPCRTILEAEGYLRSGGIEAASIGFSFGTYPCVKSCRKEDGEVVCGDHSCHCGCHKMLPNGVDLIQWMAQTKNWPKKLYLHTENPLAHQLMQNMALRLGPKKMPVGVFP